jgi:hypothetical protein
MKPYVESGNAARRALLEAAPDPHERRLKASVRSFEQVIRVIGVFALVLVPMIGVMARSTEAAAYVAINFLAVIVTLDLLERNVKKALRSARDQRTAGSIQTSENAAE